MSAFTADGFMFTIKDVNQRQQKIKLPITVSLGSFIFIIFITLLTDPIKNITWVIFFFLALFILLINLVDSIVILQRGELTPKIRHKVILGVGFLIVCLMLRSAGSLSLVDALVLILIFVASIFYFSRRR